jgi:hypothetical protein
VLTLSIDSVVYTKVATEDERVANQRTFTWVQGSKDLRVHLANTINIHSINNFVIGVTINFFKTNLTIDKFNGITGGIAYKRRLASCPDFSDSFDDLFNSKQQYSESSVEIENEDGAFSRLNEDDNFINRFILIESWFADTGWAVALTQEFMGVITNLSVGKRLKIDFKDARDKLVEETPFRILDLKTWIYCADAVVIPEVWGHCRRVPLKCINENDASNTYWYFMLADVAFLSLHSLEYIYINNVRTAAPAILVSADNIAYIQILKTAVTDIGNVCVDENGYKEVAGTLIDNPLDIIRHKIWQIYGQAYNSVYFDTSVWASALVYVFKVNYLLTEAKQFKDQIEAITGSSGGYFEINKVTNLYSFRIIGQDMSTQFSIYEKHYLPVGERNEYVTDAEKMFASVKIGYNKRYDTGTYSWYTDNSRSSVIGPYVNSDNKCKAIETNLTSETDASRAAEMFLNMYGRKLRKVSKTIYINPVNRASRSAQVISMQFDKNGFNMGSRRAFLLSNKKNYDKMELTFDAYLRGEDLGGPMQFSQGGVLTDAEFSQSGVEYPAYFVQEGP